MSSVKYESATTIELSENEIDKSKTAVHKLLRNQGFVHEFQSEILSLSFHKISDMFTPLAIFIVLVLFIYGWEFGTNSALCDVKIVIPNQIMITEFVCFVAFSANFLLILIKLMRLPSSHVANEKSLFKIYCASLIITIISVSSISYHWQLSMKNDVICTDAMGVPSFPIQWCEWLAIVPFLSYMTCIINKSKLNRDDYLAIAFSTLTISFGFLSAVIGSSIGSYTFYFFGIIFFGLKIKYLMSTSKIEHNFKTNDNGNTSDLAIEFHNLSANNKRQRSIALCCFFSVFPLIHGLTWMGILSQVEALCGFILASTFVKIGLCFVFSQSHLNLTNDIASYDTLLKACIIDELFEVNKRYESELKTLNEFRNMLSNAAHDLKTPLAGFGGAIDLIEKETFALEKYY
eukprot:gene6566-9023_t